MTSTTKLLHKSTSFAVECITLHFEKVHQGMWYKFGLVYVKTFFGLKAQNSS